MYRFLVCICAGLFFLSCTKRPVSPSKASRRAIDTLFQKEIIHLQPQFDSLCILMKDSIYPLAVDSILNERREEMNILVK